MKWIHQGDLVTYEKAERGGKKVSPFLLHYLLGYLQATVFWF